MLVITECGASTRIRRSHQGFLNKKGQTAIVKNLVSTLTVFVVLFLISGCGTNNTTATPTSASRPTITPEPTNLLVLSTATVTSTPTPGLGPGDTWTRPTDGMVMVYVPAGQFEMGSTEGSADEQPVHTVILDGFWIDQTEVTNAQYQKCVEAGKCQSPTTCNWGKPTYGEADKADHPAVCVDWQGAQDYCEWTGGRLPTEAEWEYAARGPEERIYPWGDEFDCAKGNFDDETVIDGNVVSDGEGCDGFDKTAPVGTFPDAVSWCGALDMSGNVWEWTNDWYDGDYYSSSPNENPFGPERGSSKVVRGSSWHNYNEPSLRAAYRTYSRTPDSSTYYIGFRCMHRPGQ